MRKEKCGKFFFDFSRLIIFFLIHFEPSHSVHSNVVVVEMNVFKREERVSKTLTSTCGLTWGPPLRNFLLSYNVLKILSNKEIIEA